MKSILYKWKNSKWEKDPTNGFAYSGEIIYTKGDETIEACAGQNACRIILFYDKIKEKAVLLHTNDMNGDEYKTMIKAIKIKRFNTSTTNVFVCGDEEDEDYKSWNDDIEQYLKQLRYNSCRITKGKEKNVKINPGQNELKITDRTGCNLLK